MDEQALRDYDYVEWNGRTPYFSSPVTAPAPIVIDTSEIWMTSEHELRYWTTELAVTAYALRDAIAATGTRCALAVRAYLQPPLAN